jgi:dTDP-4-dehydrorhamnose 3,5-epimerase
MKVTETALRDVLLIEPVLFGDSRGGFMECYQAERYAEAGIDCTFVQDNISYSRRGVLRGLHLQHPNGQDKLVQAIQGEIFDVAVDVRLHSATFGRWIGEVLSADNRRQLFIPKGFAHGFCVLSEVAVFHYKCSDVYAPKSEVTIAWNDPDIGIRWPIAEPELSQKDRAGRRLSAIEWRCLPALEVAA